MKGSKATGLNEPAKGTEEDHEGPSSEKSEGVDPSEGEMQSQQETNGLNFLDVPDTSSDLHTKISEDLQIALKASMLSTQGDIWLMVGA